LAYSVYIYRAVESDVHPVITGFEVVTLERQGQTLKVDGVMLKERSCVFEGLSVYGARGNNPAFLLDFRFLDRVGGERDVRSRALGYQTWGPWEIYLPRDFNSGRVLVYSTHQCWPFWKTESKLVEIAIPKESQ